MTDEVLASGTLPFTVEARVLRELGERLVRRPETALIELIKNAYDADATECRVELRAGRDMGVIDDGQGMTLSEFENAWMRIGTGVKAARSASPKFRRAITGEKGIGRFSVRFLGERLELTSVAHDRDRGMKTRLTASFDWPAYDASSDLGEIAVPYELVAVESSAGTGTTLHISRLRSPTAHIDLKHVRTASIGLVSPLRSLMVRRTVEYPKADPGFRLVLGTAGQEDAEDVAVAVLRAYALRAKLSLRGKRVRLEIFTRDSDTPYFEVSDSVAGLCGDFDADIRFFPRRGGAFQDLGVDGRKAYTWIRENAGVAVFDRDFRVAPYGESGDDWLGLTADAAHNQRKPRSALANKHFSMTDAEQSSTSDNWMLRLPEAAQLVGLVQVTGSRAPGSSGSRSAEGLVAAADREGFIANDAFVELKDLVRGAVEAMAMVDRRRQREEEEAERLRRLRALQEQAAQAAREIESSKTIPAADKNRLISAVSAMATDAAAHERATQEKVRQLEVMSLLGVVAGFMTHEFGVALDELDKSHRILADLAETAPALKDSIERLDAARKRLKEFTDYSTAYVRGSRGVPEAPYPVLPRLRLVRKTFAHYAEERDVKIEAEISRDLIAPRVPTSLYDGILLNLLTNALKAVTSFADPSNQRTVTFRAWNEKQWHYLEVADTGIGIPDILRDRVFEPLFTTTASRNDPLGSGMGLGLAIVRASVNAFGGTVRVIDPPSGFSTCVQVRLPLQPEE